MQGDWPRKQLRSLDQCQSWPGAFLAYEDTPAQQIIFASPALLRLCQCQTPEEFLTLSKASFASLIHPEDAPRVKENLAARKASASKRIGHRSVSSAPLLFYRLRGKRDPFIEVKEIERLLFHEGSCDYCIAFFAKSTDGENLTAFRDFFLERQVGINRPAGRGFLIWNLTQDSGYLRKSGFDDIPDQANGLYTYDDHRAALRQAMGAADEGQKDKLLSREGLLQAYREGHTPEPIFVDCRDGEVYSRAQIDFHLLQDPASGEVFLKLSSRKASEKEVCDAMEEAALEAVFDSVYFLDFEKDKLSLVDNLLEEQAQWQEESLSARLPFVCEKIGLGKLTLEELRKALREKVSGKRGRHWDFESPDGHYYHAHAKKVVPSKDIFAIGVNDITAETKQKLEKGKDDYAKNAILAALAADYVTICEVDVPSRRIRTFKVSSLLSPEVNEALARQDYDQAKKMMAATAVDRAYCEEFSELLDLDYMKKRLTAVPNYSFTYKSNDDLFVEVKIARADLRAYLGPSHIIIGFANRDRDIREKLASERDEVTGLYNRRKFKRDLAQLAREEHDSYCILGLDINGLKAVNDNFGHTEGDKLIKAAGKAIHEAYSDLGDCYRTGGDEFAVIILDSGSSKEYLKKKIDTAIADNAHAGDIELSLALGYACSRQHGKAGDLLVEKADIDMYADKRAHYLEKGDMHRQKMTSISRLEFASRISELRAAFDAVRIVDGRTEKPLAEAGAEPKWRETLHCFNAEEEKVLHNARSTARAIADHRTHSGFELRDGRAFFAISQYVEIEGQPAVIEMFHKIDSNAAKEDAVQTGLLRSLLSDE